MRKGFRLIVTVLLFLCAAASVHAFDDDYLQQLLQGELTFEDSTESTVIPLVPIYNYRMVVVVGNSGGKNFSFLVDTGSPGSWICGSVLAENPELMQQVGDGSYRVKRMSLGKLILTNVCFQTSDETDKIANGWAVSGIIGMNILSRMYFELDTKNKTLSFYRTPKPMDHPASLSQLYDLRLIVDGSIGSARALWMIDSGWSNGYALHPANFDTKLDSITVHGLEGTLLKRNFMQDPEKDPAIGVAKDVVIGSQKVNSMLFFSMYPLVQYSKDFSGIWQSTGIIPLEFFQDTVLQVDYPNGLIAWGDDLVNVAYNSDTPELFGIVVSTIGADRLQIVGFDSQSWANDVGLRIGDLIVDSSVQIKGNPKQPFNSKFLMNEGTSHTITFDYLRNGKSNHVEAVYYNRLLQ